MNTPAGTIRFMDQQRVNLDGFAIGDPGLGLTVFRSPHEPEPSLVVADWPVVELGGVPEADSDSIDSYIARPSLDLTSLAGRPCTSAGSGDPCPGGPGDFAARRRVKGPAGAIVRGSGPSPPKVPAWHQRRHRQLSLFSV